MAPPRIEDQNNDYFRPFQPIPIKPPVIEPAPQKIGEGLPLRADANFYGSQQRNRLERFLVPGLAGVSAFRDVRDIRLAESTARADSAYRTTYQNEKTALTDPAAINPPKNMVEVSQRAEAAYTTALKNDVLRRSTCAARASSKRRNFTHAGGDTRRFNDFIGGRDSAAHQQ